MDLLGDSVKLLGGGLVGFGLGLWTQIIKEKRDRAQLRDALYQEISNCYEAIDYYIQPERQDFAFLKSQLRNQLCFVAYDAACKTPAALYSYPEHGWLIGCYRELRTLAELTDQSDDKRLLTDLRQAMSIIENPADPKIRQRLVQVLPTKIGQRLNAQ